MSGAFLIVREFETSRTLKLLTRYHFNVWLNKVAVEGVPVA